MLKREGIKAIFYEGPIICINYKSNLITFKVNREDQSGSLKRFDKLVRGTIPKLTKKAIDVCIVANWELILACQTEVPNIELNKESLELNQEEYLIRLDKLCGFYRNTIPPSLPLPCHPSNKKKSYSSIFTTYVTIEENKIKEVRGSW